MKILYIILLMNMYPSLLCAAEVEMNGGLVRSVYLNEIDITSATNQILKNVNVTIDSKGNIYIEGSQYQVTLENSYTPLKKSPIKKAPEKKPNIAIENKPSKVKKTKKKKALPFNEKGEPTAPAQDVAKP